MIKHISSKLLGSLLLVGSIAFSTTAFAQQTGFFQTNDAQASAQAVSDTNVRRPTAVVNGAIITGTDVDQRLALLLSSSKGQLSPEQLELVRGQVLKNLIDEMLQIQAATAIELPVDNAMVEKRYAEVAARNFGSTADALKKMNAHLLKAGSSPSSLKRQIRGEMAWKHVLGRKVGPFVNVSNEEAREVLARMEANIGAPEYRVGEIFIRSTPETHAAVLQNAQQIIQQIQQGGNFTAYARQFSVSSTAAVGGDLGFVRLETLPTAMANQIRQMQVGQLNGPIDIPGGVVILLLIDQRQIGVADVRDSVLSLQQITVKVPAGADAAQSAAQSAKLSQAMQSINSCDNTGSLIQSIGAQIDANDVVANTLPPELQAPLLQLAVGQSTPVFGSSADGFSVLLLCGKKAPPGGGLPDLEQIKAEIENQRIDKGAQRYLRDLRNDARIDLG